MKCKRCKAKVERSSNDPEFCKACIKHIDEMSARSMERARAARCYFNYRGGQSDRQELLYAFLAIVHPEINHERAFRIARSVER